MAGKRAIPRFTKVVVTFEPREGGGLRVYSDDVPGFVLSHKDARAVLADVKPALEVCSHGLQLAQLVRGRLLAR
jgi:hypothetical protein